MASMDELQERPRDQLDGRCSEGLRPAPRAFRSPAPVRPMWAICGLAVALGLVLQSAAIAAPVGASESDPDVPPASVTPKRGLVREESSKDRSRNRSRLETSRASFENDEVQVSGDTARRDDLLKFVGARIGSIRSCYSRALRVDPSLKGRLVASFVITPTGRVGKCSITEDTMKSDNVSSCLTRLIQKWTLPFNADQDITATFPFTFRSGG